ncbi:hypothetical protein Nmel_005424 [Mimus melanotis]
MTGLEVKGRCCQAMQALLPLGSRSSASSTPLQAAQGTHPEGRVIPMGTHATMAILGSCLYFLPQEPATMARMGDWEIQHLQQIPEDRAWQKNPLCNPVYLLLPACTEFNQTPWGFTHFQLQISS